MAIECAKFAFAAPPKSGCRYMAQVVHQLGVINGEHSKLHVPEFVEGKPLVSVVRDPADWLRSYYTNLRNKIGWKPVDSFLDDSHPNQRNQETFERYVQDYLAGPPNKIGAMFASYEADHVFRIEDMPWAIEDWLGFRLSELPDRMETQGKLHLTAEMRRAIRQHEPEHTSRWKY